MKLLILAVVWVLAATASVAQQEPSQACETALNYHYYALQVLGQCEDPATQNTTLCELVGEFFETSTFQNASSVGHTADPTLDLLPLFVNPDTDIQNWQDYLTAGAMGMVADDGQIAYVRSRINAAWQPLVGQTLTDDQYSGLWGREWYALGDASYAAAGDSSNGYDWQSRRDAYFKAATYYFTGQWPLPTASTAVQYMSKAQEAVRLALGLWQGVNATFFSVPFTSGPLSVELPGIFITPDPTQRLPLLIYTSGTDYPKEMELHPDSASKSLRKTGGVLLLKRQVDVQALLLQNVLAALERREYAVLVYDGPGQGQVIRSPPHMPFTNDWSAVVSAFLDAANAEFEEFIDSSRIAVLGYSLGGYLAGRACAGLSGRIAACLLNPARFEMPGAYNVEAQYGIPVYGALQYAAQQDPELLLPGYAEVFSNLSNILDPLLLQCTPDSGAPEAFGAPIAASSDGPIDPELVYLAVVYGGVFSANKTDILNGLWAGYRSVQGFVNNDVANIAVPVLNFRSSEDDLLGGEEEAFQAQLNPAVAARSQLVQFDGASGAALHDQAGGAIASNAVTFAFLDSVLLMSGAGNPAATTAG